MLRQQQRIRGQSTVEYIVLAAAVIAVVILFTFPQDSGIKSRLNRTLDQTSNDIVDRAEKLFNSHSSEAGTSSPPTKEAEVNIRLNDVF